MLTFRRLMCILLTVLVVSITAGAVSAGSINSGAGTSAFSFLKINVGGRAVGMGGAFTGLADDEAALYYNPAGLVSFEEGRFIAEYHNYFVGLQSGFVGYVHPLSEDRAYGLQASYLNYGEFTQTDRAGNVEGTFGGGDLMLAGSFALRRSQEFMLGITAKFIYEKIQEYSATGLAVDLGARYTTNRGRYGGGLLIQNLGAQLSSLGEGSKASLPTTLRAGLSARPPGLNTVFATDLILPFDNDLEFALGAEYINFKPLFLRMGWNSFGSNFRTDYSDNGLAGLSFGVGVDYHSLQFSYAFTPAADLGDSHRVTITGGI
ncbi:MAG: PorV/PorQ family protein [candidate division Zixibacteria bacterium]|nr:PorV/PorQ family protein [candidate division Zixibacteria bacterium]